MGTMGKPIPSNQKTQTSVRTRGGGVSSAVGRAKTPNIEGRPIPQQRVSGMSASQGAQGRTRRPEPQSKPVIKKPMPTTAEIRAANPGRVGGGNAGASADSGGTSQIPTKTTFTKQGKQRTKAQMMAAARIAAQKASPMDRKLTGRERAQQSARDRIAAKKAEAQKF